METYFDENGTLKKRYGYDEICSCYAAHILIDLYQKLGIKRKNYLALLSIYLDHQDPLEIKTILSWQRRERGLPKRYSHEYLVEVLDNVVKECGNAEPQVLARWKQHRGPFSKLLKQVLEGAIFFDPVESFSKRMDEIYDILSPETAFILYNYFEILDSLTWEDVTFLQVLLGRDTDTRKQCTNRLIQQKIQADIILECLRDNSVSQWLGLLNRHKTERSKDDICSRLLDKVSEYSFNSSAWDFILNVLLNKKSGAFIDSFKEEEIRLLVLFKYCLSQEEQEEILRRRTDGA